MKFVTTIAVLAASFAAVGCGTSPSEETESSVMAAEVKKCGTVSKSSTPGRFILSTSAQKYNLEPADGSALNTLSGFVGKKACVRADYSTNPVFVASAGKITRS